MKNSVMLVSRTHLGNRSGPQAARKKFWFVILPHCCLCGFCFLLNCYRERHIHLTDGETEALGLWPTFLEITAKAVELYTRYRDESNLVQTLKELPPSQSSAPIWGDFTLHPHPIKGHLAIPRDIFVTTGDGGVTGIQ